MDLGGGDCELNLKQYVHVQPQGCVSFTHTDTETHICVSWCAFVCEP